MTEEEKMQKLRFLTECLLQEMPEYRNAAVPENPGEAFAFYRALCNVRTPRGPQSLPEKFYTVQAQVLRALTEEKGITEAKNLPPSQLDPRLSLWQGDITTLRCDAIVNAANSGMLGCFQPLHNCIDNIIHTMAGVELREKCYEIMQAQGHAEEPGRAKITKGYNLPARYVLHTVGPMVEGRLQKIHKELLASCYTSCLELAAAYGLTSVAFCCISTGVFHFPPQKAADIAVETVRQWLERHRSGSIRQVIFNVFKDSDREIYEKILNGN